MWTGLLLFGTNLSGQWTITGKVIDAESGEGLSYVNITFKDGATFNTTSDQQGAFKISGLTEPYYQVVSATSFARATESVSRESNP